MKGFDAYIDGEPRTEPVVNNEPPSEPVKMMFIT